MTSTTANRAPSRTRLRTSSLLGLLVAHALFGVLCAQASLFATIHAWVAVAATMWFAITDTKLRRTVVMVAYVVGSDVLWRMSGAHFFYEGPKYVVAGALGLLYFRLVRTRRHIGMPLAYFLLLLPSAMFTIQALGLAGSREDLSFNLSGPLCLAASAFFFLQIRMTWDDLRSVLIALLAPIMSIVAYATFGTVTTQIVFGDESVYASSGGFGPNQVSVLLGLGALVSLILLLRSRTMGERLVLASAGLWCFGQGVLTFSRGGIFGFGVGACVVLVFEAFASKTRGRTAVMVVLLVIGGVIVLNNLDEYTGGTLNSRFSSLDSTGRSDIADSDYALWRANPVAGVGPGRAPSSRPEPQLFGRLTHTEFTRLLAEHGALGLLALGALITMTVACGTARNTSWGRAVSLAFAAWALAGMVHADMRTAASGFIFGLAMVRLSPERQVNKTPATID
jgi:O-antigen ligase